MKKKLSTVILLLILLIGLSLLMYPSISDYWNSLHQSQAISAYSDWVADMDSTEKETIWSEANEYNLALLDNERRFKPNSLETDYYYTLLNASGNGIMGYIEIPIIKCLLPIYHGTDESILQIATGHIAGSSLPVGGESTHCVISGHRGLPSAKLFSDVDKLTDGDTFVIRVMDELLTYEIDQIRIVEPHETSDLAIEEGKDLCTLVTCTPYGVNTHRLLVRGHRIDNILDAAQSRVVSEATQIEPIIVAPLIAAPILFILLIAVLLRGDKNKPNGGTRIEK